MPVITLGSSKGGVGKTTLALMIADELANADSSVIIIDADPNQPFKRWDEAYREDHDGAGPTNIEIISPQRDSIEATILETIEEAERRAHFVIVDLEGTANMVMNYALSRSTLFLVPLQGSSLDAAEAVAAIRNVRTMSKAMNFDVPFALVFTRTSSALRTRTLKRFQEQFSASDIPVLDVEAIERQPFKVMFDYSLPLSELTDEHCSPNSLANARANARALVRAVIEKVTAALDKTAA